jgi:mRNA degradation ribonuclease J1/J2
MSIQSTQERIENEISVFIEDLRIKNGINLSEINMVFNNVLNHKMLTLNKLELAKQVISLVEEQNREILLGYKLNDRTKKEIVVLFRDTLGFIFNVNWGLKEVDVANLFSRHRTVVYHMVENTLGNIFFFSKQDCIEKKIISYLFTTCGQKDPFM